MLVTYNSLPGIIRTIRLSIHVKQLRTLWVRVFMRNANTQMILKFSGDREDNTYCLLLLIDVTFHAIDVRFKVSNLIAVSSVLRWRANERVERRVADGGGL